MIRLLSAALLALGLTSISTMAQAAPPKVFVASTGNDANDGGRATPKRSFQAAHDAVAAGGEIVALDTAGYGAVTITKSVGIVVPPGVTGFVTVASGNGITINAGTSDVVTLRGLIVQGAGSQGSGVYAGQLGRLIVEDTTFQNFQQCLNFTPSNSAQLIVRGGAARNCSEFGVRVADNGGSSNTKYDAAISDVEVTNTVYGIGVSNNSGGRTTRVVVIRNIISAASQWGIIAANGAEVVLDSSTIEANNIALFAANGGIVYSRGNNIIYNNVSAGSAPTPFAGQ